MMPHELPSWYIVYQQTQRWLAARCFEAMVEYLRLLLRGVKGRKDQPSAAIFDSRMLQSTPEGGGYSGYDGYRRRKGNKAHVAVDTLGPLLTPANEQDRTQVDKLAQRVQKATGQLVGVAFVDQAYTGGAVAEAATSLSIQLAVVKPPEAKCSFFLLLRRWGVKRSLA